jgi:hypothetical protein
MDTFFHFLQECFCRQENTDHFATFNNISAILHWWRKQEYSETTIDLPQVTDKFYHLAGSGTSKSYGHILSFFARMFL